MKARGLFTCIGLLAMCSAFAQEAVDSRTTFEKKLNAIHVDDPSRQSVFLAAANLRASDPYSGYGETLLAEYHSTSSLDRNGEPQAVFDEVMRLCATAISLNPDLAEAHVPAARALIRAGLFSQAREHIDKALKLDSELSSAIFLEADLRRVSGHPLESVADYQRFVEHAGHVGRKANGYYWMAVAYQEAADADPQNRNAYLAKARESHLKGMELVPGDAERMANYAYFLNSIGNAKEAQAMVRKALEINDFGFARWQLALAQYQLLAGRMERLDDRQLMQDTEAIFLETQIPLVHAVNYSARWPEVQTRLQPLLARALAREQAMTSNPDAIWAEGLEIADARIRFGYFREAIVLWSRGDVQAGLKRIEALDSPTERGSMRRLLVEQTAAVQPEAALNMLDSTTDNMERNMIIVGAMAAIARNDPQAALARVETLPESFRGAATTSILRVISENDPRWAAELYGDSPYRTQLTSVYDIISNYARAYPDEAIEWAESVDGLGGEIWKHALNAISLDSTDKAFQIVAGMPEGDMQESAFELVLGNLSLSNPIEAARNSEMLAEGALRTKVARRAASNWVKNEPIEALTWTLSQPESVSASVLPSIAYSLASADIDLATSVPIEEIPESARAQWIERLLDPLARKDTNQAMVWLESFKDQPQYTKWRRQVLAQTATMDPETAIELAAETSNPTEYSHDVSRILMEWARTDGEAAVNWFDSHYQGENRPMIVFVLAIGWYAKQPVRAEEWVLSINEPEERDEGILGLISKLNVTSPHWERLVDLLQLEESIDREREIRLMKLIHVDPSSAAVLLEEMNIDKDQYEIYEEQIRQNQEKMRWRAAHPETSN